MNLFNLKSTKELTAIEFKATFGEKMVNVTLNAEPVVDVWNYVDKLAKRGIVHVFVVKKELVEHVYRNDTNSFDHILLPTENSNVFIVICG